jgi:hypothetical protein
MEHGGSLNGQVNQLGPPQSATLPVRLPPSQMRFTDLLPGR